MLKKSEGLVTLTVCNPNKAKGDDVKKDEPAAATIDAKSNSITSHRSELFKGSLLEVVWQISCPFTISTFPYLLSM